MSYSKIKSFSFSKDFKTITVTSASNNVIPLSYYKQVVLKDSNEKYKNESIFSWVQSWLNDFISGGLQFNNKNHYIQYVIDTTLSNNDIINNREMWASPYDYEGKYNYDNDKWSFSSDEKEKEFNDAVLKRDQVLDKMTNNILNNTLKKEYAALKKEKYILTNGYSYITSNGKRSFKYTGKDGKIKQFSGLQKSSLKNYFAIINYGYHFEKVEA